MVGLGEGCPDSNNSTVLRWSIELFLVGHLKTVKGSVIRGLIDGGFWVRHKRLQMSFEPRVSRGQLLAGGSLVPDSGVTYPPWDRGHWEITDPFLHPPWMISSFYSNPTNKN